MTMQKITIARIFGICLFLGMGGMSLGAQWAYMMRVNGCRLSNRRVRSIYYIVELTMD